MFEWLKVTIGSDKTKPAAKRPGSKPPSPNQIKIDSRLYPLTELKRDGIVASKFDGSLIAGQRAQITVMVDDRWGKFTFDTKVVVNTSVSGDTLSGSWTMLPPEVETVIGQYLKNRRQAAAAKPKS
ncbi:MAG: hypothetical protein GC191_12535 [Azospirillum sp.]|nr:hypothetical protein [Azospirillum sp.]